MRKLFIAFALLSMLSAPAFAGDRQSASASASHGGSYNVGGSAGSVATGAAGSQ